MNEQYGVTPYILEVFSDSLASVLRTGVVLRTEQVGEQETRSFSSSLTAADKRRNRYQYLILYQLLRRRRRRRLRLFPFETIRAESSFLFHRFPLLTAAGPALFGRPYAPETHAIRNALGPRRKCLVTRGSRPIVTDTAAVARETTLLTLTVTPLNL